MERAKVFISCGQRDNTDEVEIASRVAVLLGKKGFDPFVAKQIQTLGALTGEVYKNIADSEYFLFVDFKRETLSDASGVLGVRGSLFSHQELGIASYKEMEVLTFREKGVRLEGIQSFILSNPHEFSSADELLNLIEVEVDKKWKPNWKNCLGMSVGKPAYEDALGENRRPVRYYHIAVTNRHKAKHASNCYGFIENIHCGPNRVNLKNVHAVWSGYPYPSAVLLPGDTKELDIIWHWLDGDKTIYFNAHATSGYYLPTPITQPGHHEFKMRVVSDNFPPAFETFEFDFNGNPSQISLRVVPK